MQFLIQNARWLSAGMAIAFASGYGQTFFISVFAGGIREDFELSHGAWGSIYTIGTLVSAMLMLWAGGLVDNAPIRRVAIICILGLAAVSAAMFLNTSAFGLVVIICGLRFFGQGMLGHISAVAMGRWFAKNRGSAIAISSLGFSLAEALLPFTFVALMAIVGWRMSWVFAAVAGILLIPVIWSLLAEERDPRSASDQSQSAGMDGRNWTRGQAVTHWLFWVTLPAFIGPPMFSTALFFHQVHLVGVKDWSHAAFVALIPFTTLAMVTALMVFGALVGKTGARRLLPYFPLPFVAAFLIFGETSSLVFAAVAFAFHGMGQGMLAALNGTFWPEFYGTAHLGAVRAVAVSAMVFGSAIGPGITGYLIDLGISFEDQLISIAAYMAISSGILAFAMSRVSDPRVSA